MIASYCIYWCIKCFSQHDTFRSSSSLFNPMRKDRVWSESKMRIDTRVDGGTDCRRKSKYSTKMDLCIQIIGLYLYIYIALLVVHSDQTRFQWETHGRKSSILVSSFALLLSLVAKPKSWLKDLRHNCKSSPVTPKLGELVILLIYPGFGLVPLNWWWLSLELFFFIFFSFHIFYWIKKKKTVAKQNTRKQSSVTMWNIKQLY